MTENEISEKIILCVLCEYLSALRGKKCKYYL